MPDGGYRLANAWAASVQDDQLVLVAGMPRSGTSWLAKIIDSHPDVLYRHEPDIVIRNETLPRLCAAEDWEIYAPEARAYLSQLAGVRTLKSAGSLPVFRKNGQGSVQYLTRNGITLGMRLAETLFSESWVSRIPVPDCAGNGYSPTHIAIKSVSSLGRIGLFTNSLPRARTILIVRHPCGQIASTWRGLQSGRLRSAEFCASLPRTPRLRELGIGEDSLPKLSTLERLAAEWALLNQKAIDDLEALPNSRVVLYEDLCMEPEKISRDLFAFMGLSWHPRTTDFLRDSTRPGTVERYYQVRRDPSRAMQKWRAELTHEEQQRILAIATALPVGRRFANPE